MTWKDDQEFEKNWWSNCANTYGEETKQLTYAKKMGLVAEWDYGHFPTYHLKDISVLDVGGGPTSMLLKCKGAKERVVVDPCDYPKWVENRYEYMDIDYYQAPAEQLFNVIDKNMNIFDEVWCYNVLQHTIDPEQIINNMRSVSKIIRLFEWIDEPISIGHPQLLTEERLNKALGGIGKVEQLNENGCVGKSYYGIFPTPLYKP
jgi:ubiquinone/menaquinone biosynthesis C-methylase UbiE